jgi:hypothetical protein
METYGFELGLLGADSARPNRPTKLVNIRDGTFEFGNKVYTRTLRILFLRHPSPPITTGCEKVAPSSRYFEPVRLISLKWNPW